MRIISGEFRGRTVVAPKNFDLRPTTDMAKEGLFNILNNQLDFTDSSVLDLFAGIGSISLELVSSAFLANPLCRIAASLISEIISSILLDDAPSVPSATLTPPSSIFLSGMTPLPSFRLLVGL